MNVFRQQYRELSEREKAKIESIKDAAEVLWLKLLPESDQIGGGRELSLARTKLEECVMWGVKGITG